MIKFIYYILTVIGIGYVLTGSDLLQSFRDRVSVINAIQKKFKPVNWLWDKFDGVVHCIYCASFWIGVGVYFLMDYECAYLHAIFSAFSVLGTIYIVKNLFPKI
jgi:hypothetical protein